MEIPAVNQIYFQRGTLSTSVLDRGTAWLDTGTFESFHAASSYVKIIGEHQGNKISCLEEIAWRNNWIDDDQLVVLAKEYGGNAFRTYLEQLL